MDVMNLQGPWPALQAPCTLERADEYVFTDLFRTIAGVVKYQVICRGTLCQAESVGEGPDAASSRCRGAGIE